MICRLLPVVWRLLRPFLIEFLKKYFSENKVDEVVIGLPTDLKGNISEVETDILKFIEEFQKEFSDIAVHRFDERFTSKMASFFISQSGKIKRKDRKKD
jgi:putative Holliday junction resolvase